MAIALRKIKNNAKTKSDSKGLTAKQSLGLPINNQHLLL